jgi:choline dehydrogenase
MEAVAHIGSAPGLAAPDFHLIHAPIYARIDEMSYPRPALSILQSSWTPESRGSVMVRSPDAAVPPAIQLNTVTAPADLDALVRAIRFTREIVATEPLASATALEIQPGPDVNTDAELKAWIRATVATTGHPACSAAVGTDPNSVLDHQLRVRGVAGLRVADAFALPRIPRANTNAPRSWSASAARTSCSEPVDNFLCPLSVCPLANSGSRSSRSLPCVRPTSTPSAGPTEVIADQSARRAARAHFG